MNSLHEAAHFRELMATPLGELIHAAAANIRARNPGAVAEATVCPPRKHLFDGPKPDGKCCAECKRLFKASSEYVVCRLCKIPVCRRKGTCKSVHHALHLAAIKRAKKEAASA